MSNGASTIPFLTRIGTNSPSAYRKKDTGVTVPNIESYKIESQAEADAYLNDIFSDKQRRSMDEAVVHANRLIADGHIRSYFLSQAQKLLSSDDRQI